MANGSWDEVAQHFFWPFSGETETWRGLQAILSHSQGEILWGIGDDLGVLQQGWNGADSSLRRTHESRHPQGYPGRKLVSFCSDNVPQLWRLVFSSRTVFHATQLSQWRCGWRTTKSTACHGQPNLQTWTSLKTSWMWSRWSWRVISHQTKLSCLNVWTMHLLCCCNPVVIFCK